MKAILLSFCFALMALKVSAQTTDHLSFKGVPIDGTLSEFVSKMKQSGFTLQDSENGFATLSGDFAGYKDCLVGVSTLDKKDLVYKIGVVFPEMSTWSTLSGNYFDLKEMLTQKYGQPTEVKEKFDGSSQPREDDSKMYEVKFDRCKYYSIWKTDKGAIQLSIAHAGVSSTFVKLAYFDKVNVEVIKAKALDDL